MNGPTIINARVFADSRNSSFLPVTGRPAGDLVWSASAPEASGRSPRCLGLHGDDLVVGYGDLLVVLDRGNGDVRWTHTLRGNHLFALEEAGALTLDHAGYCILLGYDSQPAAKVYLASVSPDIYLHTFAGQDGVFAYCLEEREKQVSSPDEHPVPAVSRFVHYAPDRMKVMSELRFPIRLKSAVVSDDGRRAGIATPDGLYLFAAAEQSQAAVVSLDTPAVVSLSMTTGGQALLLDTEDGAPRLRQFADDGQVMWELVLDRGEPSSQPPATSQDGHVYIVVGRQLHQISNGTVTWSYALPGSVPDVAISVLADGTVLAGCGQTMVHVSADGGEIVTKWLDSAIATRFVMAADGCIYYGSVDGVHCLR